MHRSTHLRLVIARVGFVMALASAMPQTWAQTNVKPDEVCFSGPNSSCQNNCSNPAPTAEYCEGSNVTAGYCLPLMSSPSPTCIETLNVPCGYIRYCRGNAYATDPITNAYLTCSGTYKRCTTTY